MIKINPLSTLYIGIDVSSKSNFVCAPLWIEMNHLFIASALPADKRHPAGLFQMNMLFFVLFGPCRHLCLFLGFKFKSMFCFTLQKNEASIPFGKRVVNANKK